MKHVSTIDWVALILLIIGGLNWGLVGLFHSNLINLIFGSLPFIERLIYILIGVSAFYKLYLLLTKD